MYLILKHTISFPLFAFALLALTSMTGPQSVAATKDTKAAKTHAPPHVAAPSADWAPYTFPLDIASGGVFDRAAFGDAPAGKHGRIIITNEGHFAHANRPEQRVRLYGVNLCFDANFPTHEQADKLADRLARSGYNAVRLHHYDRELLNQRKRGLVDSGDFDKDQLDRFDYLFAALKKHGLYICIDMHSMRSFSIKEVPDLGTPVEMEIKQLVPVSDAAFNAWATFARALLTHRNPYTGSTWAADPALVGVSLLNEDTFFGNITRHSPKLMALYEKAFKKWKIANPDTDPSAPRAGDDALFNRFLLETKIASDARMAACLRELGVQAPLTGDNHKTTELQTLVREHLDVVDFHDYWNHPNFKGKQWELPVIVTHQSSLKGSVYLPRSMMPVRIFGKPFTVTEFNYVWPNAARAEGALLMSGLSRLQDWDAIYNFDYATDEASAHANTAAVPLRPGRVFSLATDPIGLLADRAGAFLYLHGGIQAAPGAIALLVDDNPGTTTLFDAPRGNPRELPRAFSWLGLRTRIGTLPASRTLSDQGRIESSGIQNFVTSTSIAASDAARLPSPAFPLDDDIEKRLEQSGVLPTRKGELFQSETGQIEIDRTLGTARLVTDYAECHILPAGRKSQGDRSSVSIPTSDTFAGVYILAVDGRPFASSERLLVLHLTDSVTSGTQFSDKSRTLLEKYGTGPHLIRRGTATISIRPGTGNRTWDAWAVDTSGQRQRPVPLTTNADGTLTLEASTVSDGAVTLAYELVPR